MAPRLYITMYMFLAMALLVSCGRKDLLREFDSGHPASYKLALYPSTLRMVNISNDHTYNEMVRGVEKVRIYVYKNGSLGIDGFNGLKAELQQNGSEELVEVQNRELYFHAFSAPNSGHSIIIFGKTGPNYYLAQIDGMINVSKLPKLIGAFQKENFINIFEVIPH